MKSIRCIRGLGLFAAIALAIALPAYSQGTEPVTYSSRSTQDTLVASPVSVDAPLALPTSGLGLAALSRTNTSNKYLFIFFHSGMNEAVQPLWAVFQSAMTQLPLKAEGIAVQITDPNEQEIVRRFDVSRAPMPLVLVVAPNGAIMGGFPQQFDESKLLGAIGTPAMEYVLKAVQQQRMVFVCAQNSLTQQNEAALLGVQEMRSDPAFAAAVDVIVVDPSNPEEARFLNQLQLIPNHPVAQTALIVPPGSPAGKWTGATSKALILAQLQTSGACGPGGACAGGKCGPGGCAPPGGSQQAANQPGAVKRFFSKMASSFGR